MVEIPIATAMIGTGNQLPVAVVRLHDGFLLLGGGGSMIIGWEWWVLEYKFDPLVNSH